MDIENLKNIVINCKTKKDAITLCNAFDNLNLRWRSGERYIDDNCWDLFKDETCYYPYEGSYGVKEGFKDLLHYIVKTPK
jgi:hypothetical protein